MSVAYTNGFELIGLTAVYFHIAFPQNAVAVKAVIDFTYSPV